LSLHARMTADHGGVIVLDDGSVTVDVTDLNADERSVVAECAARVRAGRVAYGALNLAADPRNWLREAREEVLDLVIYLVFDRLAKGGR
jgi:hypothetical protein